MSPRRCREALPWSGRTLARGLEFSSYALPLGRRRNVEIGEVLGTPCYEWLDAHEQRNTTFYIEWKKVTHADAKGDVSPLSEEEIRKIVWDYKETH